MRTKISQRNSLHGVISLLAAFMFSGMLPQEAQAAQFVNWDETTDISPLDTILVPGEINIGSNTIGVTFKAIGTGNKLIKEISDLAVNFRDASIFSPAPDRVSVVRANLGFSDSVEIEFSSPVRNPTLYGNALGGNTLTFSDAFILIGADQIATVDLGARTIKGINFNNIPANMQANAGGSLEADFQIQFIGTFTSLSFTSDRAANKIDTNSYAISAVPEPSSTFLMAIAGTATMMCRRRRKVRQSACDVSYVR